SFLFLGITLYVLNRPSRLRAQQSQASVPLTSYWLLVPLFALWVNLDNWFLAGPLAVALYLLGAVVQRTFAPIRTGPDAPEPSEVRKLAFVLAAGVAACLLNPHHYHVFMVPPELYSPTLTALHAHDARILNFPSPLSSIYLRPSVGLNPAGLAY